MYKAQLVIVTNQRIDFIPSKYIEPGTKLWHDDWYYLIIDNKIYGTSYHNKGRDNGPYPGVDGSIIYLYVDKPPIIGDHVTIKDVKIKEGMTLMFV